MTQTKIWMITAVFSMLALAVVYGYCIGKAGMRNGWKPKKIYLTGLLPLFVTGLIMMIITVFSDEPSGGAHGWRKFPWVLTFTGGIMAGLIALKVAHPEVPWSQIRVSMSDSNSDNLSIR